MACFQLCRTSAPLGDASGAPLVCPSVSRPDWEAVVEAVLGLLLQRRGWGAGGLPCDAGWRPGGVLSGMKGQGMFWEWTWTGQGLGSREHRSREEGAWGSRRGPGTRDPLAGEAGVWTMNEEQ